MNTNHRHILTFEYAIVALTLFLVPLFFVPITFEYFQTNKMYLLGFAALSLLMSATFRLIVQKKLIWHRHAMDVPVLIFATAVGLSTLWASDNPLQALLNPVSGLAVIASLTVLYFYISRQEWEKRSINLVGLLTYSACIAAAIAIAVFFGIFTNMRLPSGLSFLTNPLFSPVGSLYDILALLGYFLLYQILKIIYADKADVAITQSTIGTTILISAGFAFTLIMALRTFVFATPTPTYAYLPESLAAVGHVLRNPGSLIFGIGVDDFSAAFTAVKAASHNTASYWQVDSFNLARSGLLHLIAETGILGLAGFAGMIFTLFTRIFRSAYPHKLGPALLSLYIAVLFIIFPPSLMLYFLIFITIAFTTCDLSAFEKQPLAARVTLERHRHAPLLFALAFVLFIAVTALGYLLVRAYRADMAFRSSFDSSIRNDPHGLYENQRTAVILSPYFEQYRVQLAKTNVVIANEVAASVQNSAQDATPEQKTIITEAVQAAIAQSKAAATLNPSKANNWEALGTVYSNVTGIVNGSQQWALSAYTRAVALDPSNARYHVRLGSVQYMAGQYEDAVRTFTRAADLKPDWATAWYNLAWAHYKSGDRARAIRAMERATGLINRGSAQDDYAQAQKDLETFRNE